MREITSEIYTDKDIRETDKKQKMIKALNQWLTKVGKMLNTPQLSNHK